MSVPGPGIMSSGNGWQLAIGIGYRVSGIQTWLMVPLLVLVPWNRPLVVALAIPGMLNHRLAGMSGMECLPPSITILISAYPHVTWSKLLFQIQRIFRDI